MKKTLLLTSCLIAVSLAKAQTWAKSIGGSFYDNGTCVVVDASGNVYTTGTFSDEVDFDPGTGTFNLVSTPAGVSGTATDIFISKVDASGNFVWAKNIGSNGGDYGWSIAVDAAGNVYAVGNFMALTDFDPGSAKSNITAEGSWDIFILKLDASGNFVWAKTMGGPGFEAATSIDVDGNGNIYTTGNFNGTTDFDPGTGTFKLTAVGEGDIFVSKLDASGNFVWAKSMGGPLDDGGNSMKVDGSGNVYTTGYFDGKGDFDPGTGASDLTSSGGADLFVSKLDASGNFVWAKKIGGAKNDGGNGIAVDGSGNVYLTGFFFGTVDFDPGSGTSNLSSGADDIFVTKLNSSGNFVWARSMGANLEDGGASIALDASGNVYTTGYFSGMADFNPGTGEYKLASAGSHDIFISKLDASGNFVWAVAMGGTLSDYANSIAVGSSGKIYTTGAFKGTADFDPDVNAKSNLSAKGESDIFIHQMNQPTGGIKENGIASDINIYPNPSKGILNLELGTRNDDNLKIQVLNAMGQIVMEEKAEDLRAGRQGLTPIAIGVNIQHLPDGLYVLRITKKDNVVYSQKIIKNKSYEK